MIQPFGDYSPTELGRPPTAMGAALVRGSPRPSNIVRECSAECSPAVQLPVGARVANEALSHKEGKEQQPCMAVVGQFIDNERDARHSPDIVAVPTQLNACLHHAESEGGHKLLLTPGECVVTQGIHIIPPTPPENPLHSIPCEMAHVVVDGAPMASAQIKPQQLHPTCNEVHSRVPGSSEQELQRNRCECTMYSCSAPTLLGAVTTHRLNVMHSGHVGPPGSISFTYLSFHSMLTPVLLV